MKSPAQNPAAMAPKERLTEIAAILAEACLRILAKKDSNCLDDLGNRTAHCVSTVDKKRATRKEAI